MARHIDIRDKADCCGCSACYAACPKRCISMVYDDEGFRYPAIDLASCVDCGRCMEACPLVGVHDVLGSNPVMSAYAATNRDDSVRAKSTSGGAFDAMVRAMLAKGGVVFGARFDEGFNVVHDSAEDAEYAAAFYQSKYVQSDLAANDTYRMVRDACLAGRPVLFSGTPCQVQGLRTYLGRDYTGLVTCDFVCRAVPSPREWEGYLTGLCERYGSRPVSVEFRHKTYGYHSGTMRIVFESGEVYLGSGRVDPWHKAFFADVISRPSCYQCHFRRQERASDFTIFDCWSYGSLTGRHDDDLGHSHLWVHTEKGASMLGEMREWLDLAEVRLEDVLAGDAVMATRNISRSPIREGFLACSRQQGLVKAVQTYMPVTRGDRILERSKGFLHKIGVLKLLEKMKKRGSRNRNRRYHQKSVT